MSIQKLIRWSAVAAVLSGVLDAIAILMLPSAFRTNAVQSNLWTPAFTIGMFAFLLAVLAIVGIHVRQSEAAGTLGLIGFVLAVFSSALFVGVFMIQGYVLPVLATQPNALKTANELLGPTGPLAGFFPIFLLTLLLFNLGFILFSISIMRAGVLPRWAGLLLLIGTVLSNAQIFGPVGEIISKLGAVGFDIGFVWLAYALWVGRSEMSAPSKTTM